MKGLSKCISKILDSFHMLNSLDTLFLETNYFSFGLKRLPEK